ncbi:hypothetical protein cypCar_00005547 [Cyprinus carpio]|nr:hypothetical protein cypCar_00005547 [Cyprinus carpio]
MCHSRNELVVALDLFVLNGEYGQRISNMLRSIERHADLMKEKVRAMQHIFDLKYSGLLDLKTQGVMREARCGVPDVENWTAQMEEKHHHIQVRQRRSTDRWILQCFNMSFVKCGSYERHNIRDPTALMYLKYKFLNAATYKLPRDDILGIQVLYGKLPRKNVFKFSKGY